MIGWRRRFGSTRLLVGISLALAALGVCAPSALAELRQPQIIDAATGKDAAAYGGAIGEREAWAAFIQETGGAKRLYVAHARDGAFESAVLADRGNPVEFAGLVGGGGDEAVVAFSEKVNGFEVIFARRLADGQLGSAEQVSEDGVDASFGNKMFPFDRDLSMAMNAGGAAVLCYQAGGKEFAATLPEEGQTWSAREFPLGCFEPGIDSRGHVVALGSDPNNNALVATRLVDGQLSEDVVEPDAEDQFNLAVGPSGMALAVGRDKDLHVFARRKADIAQDGDWERVGGNVEENLIEGAGSSPEDPFATLDAQGNGLLVFRDNRQPDPNDPDDNPLGYYRQLTGGEPGEGGVIAQNQSRIRLAQDTLGTVYMSYASLDFESAILREFADGALSPESSLAPGFEPYGHPNMASFSASENGNVLALIEPMGPPQRVAAVVDFTPPSGGARCGGKPATLVGTAGPDVLRGTPDDDVIVAKGGSDQVRGRGGNDRICSGAGNDDLIAGKGKDRLNGGKGKDRLNGGKGRDRLNGGKGKDRLNGGKGRDLLNGGKGPDKCNGGPGPDKSKRC